MAPKQSNLCVGPPVFVVRPVYMVYNVDRFNLVSAIDLDPADIAAAKREGLTSDSVRFLPLRARQMDAAVLLDAKTGDPLRIAVVDPW